MSKLDIIEEAESIASTGSVGMRMLTLALEALSSRALVWVAFFGAAALWTMAMLDPAWIKFAMALGYCGAVLTPILIRDARG